MSMKIVIAHLFPDLLNLYGDRGNIACLEMRLKKRGFEVETIEVMADDEVDFSKYDIVLLGGGSDKEQNIVCKKLQAVREELNAYVLQGGVMLALCGGYEILGKTYENAEGKQEGLGIIDMHTELGKERMFANVVLESDLVNMPVVGFTNHSGCTKVGENVRTLGKVVVGYGNESAQGEEGVVYENVIGTYLYGPLLPKNPQLTDWLLGRAIVRKGGDFNLEPLDDSLEIAANEYICKRFVTNK